MKLGLLVMTPGKQEGKLLEIKQPQFIIGRDPGCHLRPASPMISKRHCALIVRGEKAYIRDFGSTNGTYCNDERVEGERELKNDDQLKIGPIHFVVQLTEEPAARAGTRAPATKPTATKPAAAPAQGGAKPQVKTAPPTSDPTPA